MWREFFLLAVYSEIYYRSKVWDSQEYFKTQGPKTFLDMFSRIQRFVVIKILSRWKTTMKTTMAITRTCNMAGYTLRLFKLKQLLEQSILSCDFFETAHRQLIIPIWLICKHTISFRKSFIILSMSEIIHSEWNHLKVLKGIFKLFILNICFQKSYW